MTTLLARRAKPTAVVPLGLAGVLAMAIALAVFSAGAAGADVLSPTPPASFDGQSASTGGGTRAARCPTAFS